MAPATSFRPAIDATSVLAMVVSPAVEVRRSWLKFLVAPGDGGVPPKENGPPLPAVAA